MRNMYKKRLDIFKDSQNIKISDKDCRFILDNTVVSKQDKCFHVFVHFLILQWLSTTILYIIIY